MPIRTKSTAEVPKVHTGVKAEGKRADGPGPAKAGGESPPKGWAPGARRGKTAVTPHPPPPPPAGLSLADIKDPGVKRAASTLIDRPGKDGKRDGLITREDLDLAVRKRDPALMRTLEKAFGPDAVAGLKGGAELGKLLGAAATQAAGAVDLPGPSLPYAKLFEGPKSEWVVAFGGDTHHASSEKAPPDVGQYRGFKSFLERQGFKPETRRAGIDESGVAVYTRTLKAPDGHEHLLKVKVFNSSQFEGAADEYQVTSRERRGYFSLSHAGEGLGLGIGGTYIRPENVLKSEAPAMILAPIACKSYEHFAPGIEKYLDQHKIPREKVAYLGTTQEIEMTQADGAMAVLKQAFTGALSGKTVPTILKAADDSYSPIKSSYDAGSYQSDPNRMVNDLETASTPVLKGWLGGQSVELPKKRIYS
ncbi:MAG: hypothetical protein ACYC8T_23210 [Myxococcaceae bacterium]